MDSTSKAELLIFNQNSLTDLERAELNALNAAIDAAQHARSEWLKTKIDWVIDMDCQFIGGVNTWRASFYGSSKCGRYLVERGCAGPFSSEAEVKTWLKVNFDKEKMEQMIAAADGKMET